MFARFALFAFSVFLATSAVAGTALPVGSLTSFGSAKVSGLAVPNGTTVFSGDVIETGATHAIFTLAGGDSVVVGANASVRVTPSSIEVLRGSSRVSFRSPDLRVVASSWTLNSTGRSSAEFVRSEDGKVSVNVREGQLTARNPLAKPVLVASGRPVLLPAAAAPSPAPGPTPQVDRDRSDAALVGAYVLGAAALAMGLAVMLSDDDEDDEARRAAAAAQAAAEAARTQAAAAQAAAAAAAADAARLRADLTALQGRVNQAGPLLVEVTALQAELVAILGQIGARGSATAAEIARIAAIRTRLEQIGAQLRTLFPTPSAP